MNASRAAAFKKADELDAFMDRIVDGLESLILSGEELSDDFLMMVAQEMRETNEAIAQLRATPPEVAQVMQEAAPSPAQQLMWILAGQREDVFLEYLKTYPDPELQSLLRDPQELERVIRHLHEMMPSGQPQVSEEGIPHAEINSSNIYGFSYDPTNKTLFVKFQGGQSAGGPIYKYEGVPPAVFKAFASGSIPAKTSGQNNFGRWWRGKIPSLGAAFYELIRMGGYPYARVS